MDRPMSDIHFKIMSLGFQIRDLLSPPTKVLRETGLRPGYSVLDYGCGPGGYSIAAAGLVGESGKVYALDIHPLAVQRVQARASKRGLTNVETILSDCATGLPDQSVDVALLYDTFHMLGQQNSVLQELHRVLKQGGLLSFSDHHLHETEIVPRITRTGLFGLRRRNLRTYGFERM